MALAGTKEIKSLMISPPQKNDISITVRIVWFQLKRIEEAFQSSRLSIKKKFSSKKLQNTENAQCNIEKSNNLYALFFLIKFEPFWTQYCKELPLFLSKGMVYTRPTTTATPEPFI